MRALALLICITCFIPKGMNLRSNVSMAYQEVFCVVGMVMIGTPASAQLNCSPNITAVGWFSVAWLHRIRSLFCYFKSHETETVTCSSEQDFSGLLSSGDLAPKCPMVCLESDTSASVMYWGRNVSHRVQETRGTVCLWFACVLVIFFNIII